jgi:hypothetical protein
VGYQVQSGGKTIIFAAGELSANVWGFYQPAAQQGTARDGFAAREF